MPLHGFQLAPSVAALPTASVAVAILILGIVVLARERFSLINASFFIVAASVFVWLGNISLMFMSVDAVTAKLWARGAYIGVSLIPAAVFQFTVALLEETRRRRWLLAANWIVSAAFVALFTRTDLLLTGVYRYSWGFYPRLATASASFLCFFALLLGSSLVLLGRAIRTERTRQQKLRFRSFLIALAVGYLGSIDYLACFGISVYPLGFIAITGFVILSVVAISRFRLADLTPSFVAEHLLQTIHGGVIVTDMRGTIRIANGGATELLGYSAAELQGANLHGLLAVPRLTPNDASTFGRFGRMRNRSMSWKRKNQSFVELSVSATMLRGTGDVPVGILYAIHDLTERRRAERSEFQANHDALTGLVNRTYFTEAFHKAVERLNGSARTLAVFFVDLDGFKEVNDRHGHAIGDMVLQLVASRLRNVLREDDVVARFGGDEFVLLLQLRTGTDGELVARKVLRVVAEPYRIESLRLLLSASIGMALFPLDGRDAEEVVHAADAAMYAAKRAGKNRFRMASVQPPPPARGRDTPSSPPFNISARA